MWWLKKIQTVFLDFSYGHAAVSWSVGLLQVQEGFSFEGKSHTKIRQFLCQSSLEGLNYFLHLWLVCCLSFFWCNGLWFFSCRNSWHMNLETLTHITTIKMAGNTCAKKLSSWFFLVIVILTQSTFKWTLSKFEVKVSVEGKSLPDKIDCNRGILQLQITSVKVLVSQRTDSIACRIKHKRFFKRKINYYSSHDATYRLELLILSCGDVHPNPGHVHQPRVPSNNNNNPPLENRQRRVTKLSVFYANARSIVNKTAKLQMEIASLIVWRNGAKFTKFIFIPIHIHGCYCYSRIYLFTFNN